MKDGMLHRKRADGLEQLLVPKSFREKFLDLAHKGLIKGTEGACLHNNHDGLFYQLRRGSPRNNQEAATVAWVLVETVIVH